jgi:hypothetical protein
MEELNCNSVRPVLWDFVAGSLNQKESQNIEAHLNDCRECYLHRLEVRSVRTGIKSLPPVAVPSLLTTRLRVTASRERSRFLLRRNLATRLQDIGSTLKLMFDNLLRPLAVPAAGGILASFCCFGMIVDTLHVRVDWRNDIPVGLFTEVTMDDISPFGCVGKDIIVQLTIDSSGKVTDFSPVGVTSPEQMQEIGNLVLYSTFTPATSFGQKVSGKILVDIHHIDVRG